MFQMKWACTMFHGPIVVKTRDTANENDFLYIEWVNHINLKAKGCIFVPIYKEYIEDVKHFCSKPLPSSGSGGSSVVVALNSKSTLVLFWNSRWYWLLLLLVPYNYLAFNGTSSANRLCSMWALSSRLWCADWTLRVITKLRLSHWVPSSCSGERWWMRIPLNMVLTLAGLAGSLQVGFRLCLSCIVANRFWRFLTIVDFSEFFFWLRKLLMGMKQGSMTLVWATDYERWKLEGGVSRMVEHVDVRMIYFVLGFYLARWQTIFKFRRTYVFCFVIMVTCYGGWAVTMKYEIFWAY